MINIRIKSTAIFLIINLKDDNKHSLIYSYKTDKIKFYYFTTSKKKEKTNK